MGWRIPWKYEDSETTYAISLNGKQVQRDKISVARSKIADDEVGIYNGVLVTSPERTILELAKKLTVDELTVVLDCALRFHRHRQAQAVPVTTKERIIELIRHYPGMRGVARCRLALDQAVTGSDSPMETELRLRLRRYGISNLTCNVPVYSDSGILLFEPDLAIERLKISIQYEGAHHGGRDQIRTDVNRGRKTRAAG